MLSRRIRRRLVSDEGVSLVELIVVIGLLAMVLAIAWNLHTYMTKVNGDNEREARLSSEVRTPLMAIDKFLMQNSLIEAGSDEYSISFLTDANLDEIRERNIVQVTGTELRFTRWTITGSGVNDDLIYDYVYSTNNANIAQGEPLFTYFDSDGNVITDSGYYSSRTRTVTINIVVDYDGVVYSDSRDTYLRNRQ